MKLSIGLPRLENLWMDGTMVTKGRNLVGTAPQLLNKNFTDTSDGRQRLNEKKQLERTWKVHREGGHMPPGINMRDFKHVETMQRCPAGVTICDHFLFHEGKSSAKRQYDAVQVGTGLEIELGAWSVQLAGLPRGFGLFRKRIEGEVGKALAQEVDGQLADLMTQP